ncbi:hypothetical protein [Streptomyces colonosanans]|nr:hypothetical protein [Streptomyces colonosanans]
MTFYRVHLDRGRNAFWAMEEESEELYETAQVLLDPETGFFTDEVSERLEYVGSALLVMDRVTLDPPWRGHGLAAVLACEAITGSWPAAGPSPVRPASPTSAADG